MKKFKVKKVWYRILNVLKKVSVAVACSMVTLFLSSLPVFAATGGESNPITSSSLFTGLMKLLNDAGVAIMIISPIACGILIAVFALIRNASQNDQDKEKYKKWMHASWVTLLWVFGASSICTIIGAYFKG